MSSRIFLAFYSVNFTEYVLMIKCVLCCSLVSQYVCRTIQVHKFLALIYLILSDGMPRRRLGVQTLVQSVCIIFNVQTAKYY